MYTNQNTPYNGVCYGEILWDLLPSGPQLGGAPMNVSYHLQKLGDKTAMISRIGLDTRGKELLDILQERKLSSEFIQLGTELPTGIVHANPNGHGEMQYEIVSPAAWDSIEASDELHRLINGSQYFVFGSLITRNKSSRKSLFELMESASCRVLDINLRPPFFSRETVQLLLQKAHVVKMNIAELELITGWFSQYKDTKDRMAAIQDKFKTGTLIVTMGDKGALVSVDGKLYTHLGYKVKVADTVGSGDAFLAAFLFKWLRKTAPDKTLEFASALGALVASRPGGCPEYSSHEIDELISANISHSYTI